jgi:hypothetical protein
MPCKAGKTEYATEGQARSAIRGMRRQGKVGVDLRVYSCGDHFHLSKQASIASKVTKPHALKYRGPEPLLLTKAEIRHTKNRLADLGRIIEKGFARLAEERFEEAYRQWQANERARRLAESLAEDIQRQRTVLELLGIK